MEQGTNMMWYFFESGVCANKLDCAMTLGERGEEIVVCVQMDSSMATDFAHRGWRVLDENTFSPSL